MSPRIAQSSMRRAVFVSDVHLGSKHCHAAEFADFLAGLRCRRLYLVGDIVDLWWMAQRRASWDAAHNRVVEALHALARNGTELIYVPGNHDRPVRRFCGLMLPAMQVLELATRRGADAIGLGDRIGSLEPGKDADLITVSMDGARQTPMFNPISHLVYVSRGDDVRTSIVAGRILMRDGVVRTLKADEVLRDARAMAERVRVAVAPTATAKGK